MPNTQLMEIKAFIYIYIYIYICMYVYISPTGLTLGVLVEGGPHWFSLLSIVFF